MTINGKKVDALEKNILTLLFEVILIPVICGGIVSVKGFPLTVKSSNQNLSADCLSYPLLIMSQQ